MERKQIKRVDCKDGDIVWYLNKIIEFNSNYQRVNFIEPNNQKYSRVAFNFDEKIYEATEVEKVHLRACIENQKYIEATYAKKEDTINNYQIY